MAQTEKTMPVDNSLYTTHADSWWDENYFLYVLKTGLNPARFGYFRKVFSRLGLDPAQLTGLEVGCGGGLLTEEFAQLGCHMNGIDPSEASLEAARRHAAQENLQIAYRTGVGEALPFPDASFDVVICCDVLEHVKDVKAVIAESTRVLKPGGLYCYDTINRTLKSWVETIFVGQVFPPTRFFAPNTHAWEQFIKPDELLVALQQAGLTHQEMIGLRPGIPAPLVAVELLQRGLGRINFAELGRRLKFEAAGGLGGSYAGYALKPV